jgi:hypothetical protein
MTDTEMVIGYLKTSYWAAHVPQDLIVSSIWTSLVYNLVDEFANRQIGCSIANHHD